jgi:hypothetical protein
LGEKAHIETEVQYMFHRIHLSPVDIHRIGNGLKGVKGNTHRKQDGTHFEMGTGSPVRPKCQVVDNLQVELKETVKRIHKEIGILEIRQQKEVHHHTHDHPELLPCRLLAMMDKVPQVEIRNRGEDQDQKKESGGLPVEKKARCKEKGISGSTLLIDQGINQKHYKIKPPEEHPGEDQRLLGIEEKYVPPSTQLTLLSFSNSLYSSIKAL